MMATLPGMSYKVWEVTGSDQQYLNRVSAAGLLLIYPGIAVSTQAPIEGLIFSVPPEILAYGLNSVAYTVTFWWAVRY